MEAIYLVYCMRANWTHQRCNSCSCYKYTHTHSLIHTHTHIHTSSANCIVWQSGRFQLERYTVCRFGRSPIFHSLTEEQFFQVTLPSIRCRSQWVEAISTITRVKYTSIECTQCRVALSSSSSSSKSSSQSPRWSRVSKWHLSYFVCINLTQKVPFITNRDTATLDYTGS